MNALLKRRNGKIYFGAWRIDQYECACWLMSYNQLLGTKIRPDTMTAELFHEFLAYQRRVRRVGYANAPILRERITLSVDHPRINTYADKLNSMDRDRLMLAMYASERVAVFHIDAPAVTLAGTYGWCERCLDAPGVHDGERVGREGERLCDSCFDELYQDNGLPSIHVSLAEVEPAGMVPA